MNITKPLVTSTAHKLYRGKLAVWKLDVDSNNCVVYPDKYGSRHDIYIKPHGMEDPSIDENELVVLRNFEITNGFAFGTLIYKDSKFTMIYAWKGIDDRITLRILYSRY